MGTILIRCPATEAYIPTGVTMDYATFFETELGDRQLICPDCGAVHHWTRNDAWLKQRPEGELPLAP